MRKDDEQITDLERLISRSLDGALREDESLMLNRELMRNPEARRLMEDMQRVEAAAGFALEAFLAETDKAHVAPMVDSANVADIDAYENEVATLRPGRGRWHSIRFLVPGAIAAALLALLIPRPDFRPHYPNGDAAPMVKAPMEAPRVASNGYASSEVMKPVSLPTVQRRTGREVLGVMGLDGNLYFIEVNRTRTLQRPGPPLASVMTDEM